MRALVFLALSYLAAGVCQAQSTLPQGIGLYQYGYRAFDPQTFRYDVDGEKVPLGLKFNKDLSGPTILKGKGGSELKRLADELARYDRENGGAGLAESLELGQVRGDVQADVKAQFIGLAFGVTKKLTLFLGLPWVDATVKTEITHTGTNNAKEIKERLGNLAFAELKDGLDRAAKINNTQIKQSIEDEGYAPIDEWSHAGPGDLKLGAKTGGSMKLGGPTDLGLDLTGNVDVPTGYVEDADILTDVSFGRGYYSLGLQAAPRLTVFKTWFVGFDVFYAKNLETKLEKRLPVDDEDLVRADRRATVTLKPGDDNENAAVLGYGKGWLEANLRVGAKRHFSDAYSGKYEGNYGRLAEESGSYQLFQEIGLGLSSVEAFGKKSFPVPFILRFKMHQPIEARNSSNEKYYEASLASFFSTPMARDERADRSPKRSRRVRDAH